MASLLEMTDEASAEELPPKAGGSRQPSSRKPSGRRDSSGDVGEMKEGGSEEEEKGGDG